MNAMKTAVLSLIAVAGTFATADNARAQIGGSLGKAVGGGLKELDLTNKNSAVNKAGVRPGDLLPKLPSRPGMSTLPVMPFATGPVILENNFGVTLKVNVYHPANPTVVSWVYNFPPSSKLYLDSANFIVGEDWGVQALFPNGVKSAVKKVGSVARHDGTFFMFASDLAK